MSEKILMRILVIVLTILFSALPLMWFWNWLMPEIFSLKELSYLQSIGMLFLTTILFKDSTINKK